MCIMCIYIYIYIYIQVRGPRGLERPRLPAGLLAPGGHVPDADAGV